MRPFEYAAPKTDRQALGLLGTTWTDAAVLAGGTDLLALLKDDIVTPKRVVNLKQIAGLDRITFDPNVGMRVGALVRIADFADNADVRRRYPTLAAVADDAASPQLRNMATMGGNICQRPRCWYFRNGFGLLAQQNGKSLVTQGDNRYHAILGNDGPAYFVSPSSIAPALIAHHAIVRILGPRREREVPLDQFFHIPESEQERELNLFPNEIVTEILVPPPPAGRKSAQYEVRQKTTFDWPLATASVALTLSGNTVKDARVVLGHVAPIPWISKEAEQALAGREINEQVADAAGQAAVSKAKGLGRNDYKIQLTRVAVKRALLDAVKGGRA